MIKDYAATPKLNTFIWAFDFDRQPLIQVQVQAELTMTIPWGEINFGELVLLFEGLIVIEKIFGIRYVYIV